MELALYAAGLGLVDSVNPASIGFLVILFPLMRQPAEGFWYVGGTFVTYLLVGFGLYAGLAVSLNILFTTIPPLAWQIAELSAGLGLFLLGFLLWSKPADRKNPPELRHVGPLALILLGASNTLFDLPTSLPYIALLGRLTAVEAGPVLAIPFLAAYNLVYIAPMVALQVAYLIFREGIRTTLDKISRLFERTNRVLMIGVPILAGLVLTADAIFRLSAFGGAD